MKRLIFQVCLGQQSNSKLYKHCIQSVNHYAHGHGIEHIVLRMPKLKIKPDPFSTNRSKESYQKHGGYLPIYEKENAFDLLDEYDQIAIIDSDVYIRENAPNIFDDMGEDDAIGAVVERDMPITDAYKQKITTYSKMQYEPLKNEGDFRPSKFGYEFANMGVIVLNCAKFKEYLQGDTAKSFINRLEFKRFVDGVGAWKWSTDQTLLNYFIKKHKVPFKRLDWKWNGLYTANTQIKDCHFVHFFLKDKLPARGEKVDDLMKQI